MKINLLKFMPVRNWTSKSIFNPDSSVQRNLRGLRNLGGLAELPGFNFKLLHRVQKI